MGVQMQDKYKDLKESLAKKDLMGFLRPASGGGQVARRASSAKVTIEPIPDISGEAHHQESAKRR